MDSLKEQISNIGEYCKNKIIGGYSEGYHLEEKQKQLFYLSKFTIDTNELFSIFQFVNKIQVQVFKEINAELQKCVNNVLIFENNSLSEKDKVLTLYSACYLHYYRNYAYETNNTFSDYFDVNFLKLCESYKFSIKSISNFQTYVYSFYKQMQIEIKKQNYSRLKKLYKYYNPYIVKGDEDENQKTNGNIEMIQKKLLTMITCVKERIVDMVFEIKVKSNLDKHPKEIHFINSSFNKINNMTKDYLEEQNSIDANDSDSNNNMSIDEESSSESQQDTSIYSKRVLSELVKFEADKVSKDYIMKLSEKIDEFYLDQKLNEMKDPMIIGSFVCYMVDFYSDFIRTIPGYADADENLILRFIVPVKELYNLVLEVFFSISNLIYMNMTSFLEVCVKKGIPMKCACCLYSFFRKLLKLMVEEGRNALPKMKELFEKVYSMENVVWDKEVNEAGKNFTSFCNL